MRSIGCRTQICAVIGHPVGHSLSPAIHNAAYEALDLDFVYVACPVEDVKGALTGMRALGNFRGLSVTVPHKIEVMKYVDEVAQVDRSIGSINTVIHDGDKLIGLGTDGPAALKALVDSGVELAGKRVLMVGAGGAARAISFTLARNATQAELAILDIDEAVLRKLAADLEAGTDAVVKPAVSSERSLAEAMETAELVTQMLPRYLRSCSGPGRLSSTSYTRRSKRDCSAMRSLAGSKRFPGSRCSSTRGFCSSSVSQASRRPPRSCGGGPWTT